MRALLSFRAAASSSRRDKQKKMPKLIVLIFGLSPLSKHYSILEISERLEKLAGASAILAPSQPLGGAKGPPQGVGATEGGAL